jgi:hypothetical protein
MKKLFLLIILSFLLVASAVNAAPALVGTVPNQVKNEDEAAWTLDLTPYESGNAGETATQLDWSVSGVNTSLINIAVTDLAGDIVTFTPVANAQGTDTITFTLTSELGGTVSQDITVTLNPVNDAPALVTTIPTQIWPGGFPWTLELNTYFRDVDVDALTYTSTVVEGVDITTSISGTTATFTFTNEDFVGDNKVKFTASDASGASVTSTDVILRKDQPAICNIDEEKNIKIGDVDFDDTEYNVGDTVSVDISDVEALVDLEGVKVEVSLYNKNKNKIIDSWKSDEELDINDGEKEDYSVEFDIPNDEDIGSNDNYLLIVTATGDEADSGDNQCVQRSDTVDIARDDHNVMIKDVNIVPATLSCGDSASIVVDIENIGTKDENDVYVEIVEQELGWNERSANYDLDKFSKSDNDATVRFNLKIPANAVAKAYEINPLVYFDDGDKTNDGFATLTVSKCESVSEVTTLNVNTESDTKINTGAESVNLHLLITNNEGKDLNAILDLKPVGSWATTVTNQAITLHSGENNLYLDLDLNELTAGTKTLIVSVKPASAGEFITKEFNLNFEVGENKEGLKEVTGGVVGGLKASNVFWIIGDVVLVIVALFFLKMIFFGKK